MTPVAQCYKKANMETTTTKLTPFQTVSIKDYVVRLSDSDCGSYTTGNTFDEFVLVHKNGESNPIVATLRCNYSEDGTDYVLKADRNHYVPFVAGDLHLTAAILDTVMHAFTPDHEFYNEIFETTPELALQVAA